MQAPRSRAGDAMQEYRVLQIVFCVALGVFVAGGMASTYLHGLTVTGSGLSTLLFWIAIADITRAAAFIAATVTVLAGLYEVLGLPRPTGAPRPVQGLVISIIGVALAGAPVALPISGITGGATGGGFVWVLVAATVGSILFLIGLAMMILCDPALTWDARAPPASG